MNVNFLKGTEAAYKALSPVATNFYYLTGLRKPNIYLVFKKEKGKITEKIITPTYKKSVWVESSYKVSDVQKISGIKDVLYYDKEPKFDDAKNVFTDFSNKDFVISESKDCAPMIEKLRAVKNEYEIKQIKKAISITKQGLLKAWKELKTLKTEYEVQSVFEGKLMFCGVKDLAFASIIAGGKNACTLHYSQNSKPLKHGELLLFDVGAKWNEFSADISRTVPVLKTFSPVQKKFYNLVLRAQKHIISLIKPKVTIKELNGELIDFYYRELLKIDKTLIKDKKDVLKYYMHNVGHSLGLNTHDEGIGKDDKLECGNVITVEPGLYIEKYKIGIRIEDDVLVTKNGCEVLSRSIPKTINAIEKLLK